MFSPLAVYLEADPLPGRVVPDLPGRVPHRSHGVEEDHAVVMEDDEPDDANARVRGPHRHEQLPCGAFLWAVYLKIYGLNGENFIFRTIDLPFLCLVVLFPRLYLNFS